MVGSVFRRSPLGELHFRDIRLGIPEPLAWRPPLGQIEGIRRSIVGEALQSQDGVGLEQLGFDMAEQDTPVTLPMAFAVDHQQVDHITCRNTVADDLTVLLHDPARVQMATQVLFDAAAGEPGLDRSLAEETRVAGANGPYRERDQLRMVGALGRSDGYGGATPST